MFSFQFEFFTLSQAKCLQQKRHSKSAYYLPPPLLKSLPDFVFFCTGGLVLLMLSPCIFASGFFGNPLAICITTFHCMLFIIVAESAVIAVLVLAVLVIAVLVIAVLVIAVLVIAVVVAVIVVVLI